MANKTYTVCTSIENRLDYPKLAAELTKAIVRALALDGWTLRICPERISAIDLVNQMDYLAKVEPVTFSDLTDERRMKLIDGGWMDLLLKRGWSPDATEYQQKTLECDVFTVLGLNLDDPVDFLICWTVKGMIHPIYSRTALGAAQKARVPIHNLGKRDEAVKAMRMIRRLERQRDLTLMAYDMSVDE